MVDRGGGSIGEKGESASAGIRMSSEGSLSPMMQEIELLGQELWFD